MKKGILNLILIPFLLIYTLPVGAVEKEERKWQDETIYFLMVDRFNNGDQKNDFHVDLKNPTAYHGGDFQGVIDQLDYIKDMGFTTIRLSPIFDNGEGGYHGYWIEDFYNTEEHFGDVTSFKELVQQAHNRDIKIILDFVANHVSPNHPWTNDPLKKDWFHERKEITDSNNLEQLKTGWVNGLPDLAQENPNVKNYLIDVAKWWIKETNIDGYVLDSAEHVPLDFWLEFTNEVKGVKKDFYLIGDVSLQTTDNIAMYTEAGMDGLLDHPLNSELRTAFANTDVAMNQLFDIAWTNQEMFEDPYLLGTFMDNQDSIRFTREAVSNRQHPGTRWKLALTYLYTWPGIPIVYYGSEIALDGGEAPDNRRQMSFRADTELIDYITKLGELRQTLPSLTRGTLELLYEKDGMAVYKRTYQEETSVIAINNTSKTQNITFASKELEGDKELRGLLAGDLVRSTDQGEYHLVIEREEAEIYVLAEKTGLNIPYLVVMGTVYTAFFLFIFLIWKRSKKKKSQE